MKIIAVILACIYLNGCSINSGHKETPVIQSKNEVDIRPYCFPKDNLQQPEVLEYVNDVTGDKKYYKLDLINGSKGYIINTTMYDDSFQKIAFEIDSINETYITTAQMQLISSDEDAKEEVNTDKVKYPCIQSFSDAPAFSTQYTIKKGDDKYRITSQHHFSRAITPTSQFYYKGQDCIKDEVENKLAPNGALTQQEITINKEVFYYAKGVGLVFYETTDFLNRKVNQYRLDKVISVGDFNKKAPSLNGVN